VDERVDNDGPIQNDTSLDNYNGEERAAKLINHVTEVLSQQKSKKNVMILWGDDFSFQNAKAQYKNLELAMELANNYQKVNMEFVQSTPQTYVNALKAENLEYPVKTDDFFPYAKANHFYWSGYYSTRPGFKKQVKETSAMFTAQSNLAAEKVIEEGVTPKEIEDIMDSNFAMLDALGVAQHHDAITGTGRQYVNNDFQYRLQQGLDKSRITYKSQLKSKLEKDFGITLENKDILACTGTQNDTVTDCPVYKNKDKTDMLVIVHNSQGRTSKKLVRVKLPTANYKAQIFDDTKKAF